MQLFNEKVRLLATEKAFEAFAAMATMESELTNLKNKKYLDETAIKKRIVNEYNSLVQELVTEISTLRGKFHEFEINTFNEIMRIMAECKNQRLEIMADDVRFPNRDFVSSLQMHEAQISDFRQQNYESRISVLKIRSLFMVKSQVILN